MSRVPEELVIAVNKTAFTLKELIALFESAHARAIDRNGIQKWQNAGFGQLRGQ